MYIEKKNEKKRSILLERILWGGVNIYVCVYSIF